MCGQPRCGDLPSRCRTERVSERYHWDLQCWMYTVKEHRYFPSIQELRSLRHSPLLRTVKSSIPASQARALPGQVSHQFGYSQVHHVLPGILG